MADSYTVEDFCVVFDRSKNLHSVEIRESVEKPLPQDYVDQYFTRYEYARDSVAAYCLRQKATPVKGK